MLPIVPDSSRGWRFCSFNDVVSRAVSCSSLVTHGVKRASLKTLLFRARRRLLDLLGAEPPRAAGGQSTQAAGGPSRRTE